jgi:integrase
VLGHLEDRHPEPGPDHAAVPRRAAVSEALALRPADVDPERGTVRVMDGKGHKPRTVGLDPGAMATVQRWADKRREAGIRGRVLL